jgi:hypothetical protein
MRNRIETTQQQTQKVQADFENAIIRSDTPRYIFVGILIASIVLWGVWLFTGILLHIVFIVWLCVFTLAVMSWIAHWIYHELYIMHHERMTVEFRTHFFVAGESIIGDYTTQGYRHFHPNIPEPLQQMDVIENLAPDTWEQSNDRSIYNMKEKQHMTWSDIVGQYDEGLGMTMSKVRSAYNRHSKRLQEGDTHEF